MGEPVHCNSPWFVAVIYSSVAGVLTCLLTYSHAGTSPAHMSVTLAARNNYYQMCRPDPLERVVWKNRGSCWCHGMEALSALLALCEGIPQSVVDFPKNYQHCGALMFLFCRTLINSQSAGDFWHDDALVKLLQWSGVYQVYVDIHHAYMFEQRHKTYLIYGNCIDIPIPILLKTIPEKNTQRLWMMIKNADYFALKLNRINKMIS